MRSSGPAFAYKLSAIQFCKLLGQEGFLGSSKDLYQSSAAGYHPRINFCSFGGNVL